MDARRQRYEHGDLPPLLIDIDRVIVAKGRRSLTFASNDGGFDLDALSGDMLGRSGTLRAPTARVGRTLLVGFSEEAWSGVFDVV